MGSERNKRTHTDCDVMLQLPSDFSSESGFFCWRLDVVYAVLKNWLISSFDFLLFLCVIKSKHKSEIE